MSTKVAEIENMVTADDRASWITNLWSKYNDQRAGKIKEWEELRNFIFATDTTTTSNQDLPWKNTTTLPKLTQIRDNLHSNYLSALFPNDSWLNWEGYSNDDSTKTKRVAIEAYMGNKTREGHFRKTMSKLLYDYIDYGNCFSTVDYLTKYKIGTDGERIVDFVGPVARRISPLDIVFNPLADNFQDGWKIIRSIKSLGEIEAMAQDEPENASLHEAILHRRDLQNKIGGYSREDFVKAVGLEVDGFGSYYEYLMSDYAELLEFRGDFRDTTTGVLKRNVIITVFDRTAIIREEPEKTWFGHTPIYHVGWRTRQDNLWSMGPLDNLVGMQYRIDHLENLKSDAFDLAIHPPLVISGEVEEFIYKPGAQIIADEGGTVSELGKSISGVITARNEISEIEAKMELYAGAPREAMGVRSPGEKTAFEVQSLENAAGRIFQEKITTFETELLEPQLNAMLESARRNLDASDIIRTIDPDIGIANFLTVTKQDITANGKLRPVGARHFAAQAQMLQNLTSIFNSPIGQQIAPHTSSKALAAVVEDMLGVERFKLFKPNVALSEAQETERLGSQMQEDNAVIQSLPTE